MRRRFGKDRIYLIVTGLLLQIVLSLPWLSIGGERFTSYGYLAALHAAKSSEVYLSAELTSLGIEFWDPISNMLIIMKVHMVMLLAVQLLGLVNLFLAMRIMTNLHDAEQHGATPTVAVNKHRTVRLWISAAAACLAVMVVATALLFQQDSPQQVYKVQATEMSGDRFVDEADDYAMIDNTDIYAYLEDN